MAKPAVFLKQIVMFAQSVDKNMSLTFLLTAYGWGEENNQIEDDLKVSNLRNETLELK